MSKIPKCNVKVGI